MSYNSGVFNPQVMTHYWAIIFSEQGCGNCASMRMCTALLAPGKVGDWCYKWSKQRDWKWVQNLYTLLIQFPETQGYWACISGSRLNFVTSRKISTTDKYSKFSTSLLNPNLYHPYKEDSGFRVIKYLELLLSSRPVHKDHYLAASHSITV